MAGIAQRRHHRNRLLAKRKRDNYWGKKDFIDPTNQEDITWWEECMSAAVDTPHPCSRECCGNPRRFGRYEPKLTIQERKQETVQENIASWQV